MELKNILILKTYQINKNSNKKMRMKFYKKKHLGWVKFKKIKIYLV